MDVDAALSRLGKHGAWQIQGLILVSASANFLLDWQTFIVIFIGDIPEHRCQLPPQNSSDYNVTGWTADVHHDGRCHMYSNATNTSTACTHGWQYDLPHGPTIVSEWDLVCERNYMMELSQTLFMVGMTISDFFITAIADYFGRKRAHVTACVLLSIVSSITAFVPNYYAFAALRFVTGVLLDGIYGTGMVWMSEHFSSDVRPVASSIGLFGWPVATCILVPIAYLIPHWRYLQLVLGILCLFPVSYIWLVDESIPWLCATRNFEKAERILRKAAKRNGIRDISWTLQRSSSINDVHENETVKMMTSPENDISRKENESTFMSSISLRPAKKDDNILDVLRHRKLRYYLLIISFLWLINNWAYYGVILGIGSLAGNLYLNMLLTAAVDTLAVVAIITISKWFGRLPTIISGQLIVGIGLIISTFIPKSTANGTNLVPLITTIVMVALQGTATAFATLCVYTPEVFPTPVRNLSFGIAMLLGRIGGILAPFYIHMGKNIYWLPPVVIGGASILFGLAGFTLPETGKRPLFQNIQDMNTWEKEQKNRKSKSKTKHQYEHANA